MTIPIRCPKCKRFKPAPDQWAGKLVACDDCGARFKVPVPGVRRPKERNDQPAAGPSRAPATPAAKEPRQAGPATVLATCDACGRQYDVPIDLADRRCLCLHCGAAVEIPILLTDADVEAE